MQSVSRQLKQLSGCAAVELRVTDGELQYCWFCDFVALPQYRDVPFRHHEKTGFIPVLKQNTALEEICADLFQTRYEPILHYEYNRTHRYITDTAVTLPLTGSQKTVSKLLTETGFGSMLLLPFSVQDNPPGLLILYGKEAGFLPPQDIPAYEYLMHSLSIAVKFRRALNALNERIKELTCLYEINQIYQDNADDPETLLYKIVMHIPQAFQYPAAASALIVIGELEYVSDRLYRSANCLTSVILYNAEPVGSLTVYYPDHLEGTEPMHFLPEEQKLLDIIAQKVALIYEKLTFQQHREAMEVQLRHADRLATIGQLASGIAHELNDPLANILGYAQLLKKTPMDTAQMQDLDRIVRSSLHAREIVRKLLLFARQLPTRMSGISLNKVIIDTLDLLKSRLEQGSVVVQTELQPDLPELTADPSQMTQVITNLSVNALQAMPDGGKLSIKTSLREQHIYLEISDTGIGMDAETRAKIFLPFFSTKPVGIGTGLGLSVVHGIITSHNGTIEVHSEPDKGSSFVVTLPVNADPQI